MYIIGLLSTLENTEGKLNVGLIKKAKKTSY